MRNYSNFFPIIKSALLRQEHHLNSHNCDTTIVQKKIVIPKEYSIYIYFDEKGKGM